MRAIILALVLLLGNLSAPDLAQARPGGGHSSSGHSSSSSHSSSHSSSSHSSSFSRGYSSGVPVNSSPVATMFFLILFVIVIIVILKNQNNPQSFSSAPTLINRANRQNKIRDALALLKQSDPNFSGILFLDFVHSLYSKFYSYSTHPEFSYLSPFLSTELQKHFEEATPWTVNEVVINGIQWEDIVTVDTTESICLGIDANYTLHLQNKRTRYAVTERWLLSRQKGLQSPEPDKMQTLCCPYCGAPAHFTDAGVCEHCGSVVHKGEMQWHLAKRVVLRTTALAAGDLVSYAEEQGTQLATIKQADLTEQLTSFQQRHSLADWNVFWQPFVDDIVKAFFLTIYAHWSKRDWQAVRHLLSDRLYEANLFWQNLYVENNWFNRLDNIKIEQVELVKIEQDKFYEAITVRIFASCNDYTEDADGKIIGGSKRALRRYSEYWTFVRRTGTEKHSAPYSLNQCPQCGAPADKMGQTAECGYCGSKISTGEFSWVLFLIMQDDVYEG